MKLLPNITTLAAALLLTGGLHAQARAPVAPEARAAELATAQADLERAARRVAELSRASVPEARAIELKHAVRKPVLGVVLAPDPQAGVRIVAVTPRSGAAKAGLRSGDRLVSVNGHSITGSSDQGRVESARDLLDDLDTKTPVQLEYVRDGHNAKVKAMPSADRDIATYAWVDDQGNFNQAFGDVLFDGPDAAKGLTARAFVTTPPGITPQLRQEIARIGAPCEGSACRLPLLADAFRWNGLNLATVDAQLGRYFGTSSGVLVLSAGDSLTGLQPGDVLRSIDGKRVSTPREAMAALQARPQGSQVSVEYLRDRKPSTTRLTVPKAFSWPSPPRAPLPPQPPMGPRAPVAPPTPPAASLEAGPPLVGGVALAVAAAPAPVDTSDTDVY